MLITVKTLSAVYFHKSAVDPILMIRRRPSVYNLYVFVLNGSREISSAAAAAATLPGRIGFWCFVYCFWIILLLSLFTSLACSVLAFRRRYVVM